MPTTKKTSKKNKKAPQGFAGKLKSFATRQARPLLALVIVAGVVGVGYFGFVRSNANSLNSAPPTVTCGKKLTNKECNQKQAASDAAFYSQLQKDCNAANRVYSGKGCGGCKAGFVEKNGSCKEREPVNCAAQNRKQDGKYDCGGCIAGHAEGGAGNCRAKVDCDAQHRTQKNEFACGECKGNFAENGGACKRVVDCAAQNRKQVDQFKCGDCKSGFASSGNAGACASTAAQANLCASVFKKFDPKTFSCTTCINGYKADGSKCVKDSSVKLTQADCNAQHRTFNAKTSKCGGCVSGFKVNSSGACVAGTAAALSCAGGQVLVGGKCQKSVEKTCDAQHKQYSKEKNICRDSCQSGYYPSGKQCLELKRPKEDATIKAACDAAFQVYDTKTNSCLKKTCIDKYYLKDSKCVPVPNNVENCKKNVDGSCATDPKIVKAACAGQHLEYNAKLNICRKSCVDNYYADGNVCKPVAPGNPKSVRATCDKLNLTYDSKANMCRANCKTDYVIRDGKCVKWEEAGMSKWRCNALGRVWVPESTATLEDGTTQVIAAGCTEVCRDTTNSVYTDTKNVDTSYCKANEGLGNYGVGVTTELKRDECRKLNRAWIEALDACAARCKTGYFLSLGACMEKKPATTPNTEGTGTDGNGTTDGCQADLQQQSSPDDETPANPAALVCPDDEPAVPPTETKGDKIKHNVETNLTKEACRLLGRQWVSKGEDEKGNKTPAGCSTQDCRSKDAEARKSGGSVYCTGSILRISKEKCQALHRVWSPIVDGCLENAVPNSTRPKIDAAQCQEPYTVLIRHTAKQGFDECVKPSTFNRLQSIAKDAGKPVAYVASLPAAGICKLRPHMQWVDGQCVKERIAKPPKSSGGSSSSSNPPGATVSQTSGSTSGVTAAWCRSTLGRGYDAARNTCSRTCVNGGTITNYSDSSRWDICQKKSTSSGGSEGVTCPGNMIEVDGQCFGHGTGAYPNAIQDKACADFVRVFTKYKCALAPSYFICPFGYPNQGTKTEKKGDGYWRASVCYA